MKICQKCGKQNGDTVNFCGNCGSPLITNTPAEQHAKKSKTSAAFIAVMSIVVIILVAVIVVLAVKIHNTSNIKEADDVVTEQTIASDKGTLVDLPVTSSSENTAPTIVAPGRDKRYNHNSDIYSYIEFKDDKIYMGFNLMEGTCVGVASYTLDGNTITLGEVYAYSSSFDGETTYAEDTGDKTLLLTEGCTLSYDETIVYPQNFESHWVLRGWTLPMGYFSGTAFYAVS